MGWLCFVLVYSTKQRQKLAYVPRIGTRLTLSPGERENTGPRVGHPMRGLKCALCSRHSAYAKEEWVVQTTEREGERALL